jgi:anti-anti-sigma regulatory factor
MKITTSQTDGATVIKIEGDLLIAGVADAKPAIVSALAAADETRLDLGGIEECDTAGVQLLLMVRASLLARGKPFVTTAQSASFQAAVQRVGVPGGCFDSSVGMC